MTQLIEVKTAELSGAALDYAVAVVCGLGTSYAIRAHSVGYRPSTDWNQCGPLLTEYSIEFEFVTDATIQAFTLIDSGVGFGPDHMIAACRAIVSAELGDVVQVPAELVGGE